MRICTTVIKHAENIAFLSPDAYVEIRARDDIDIKEIDVLGISLPQLTSFARAANIPGGRS